MALATALYGFFGLLLAFRLARQYVEERWALLATLAIWWASSLPVYMYFNLRGRTRIPPSPLPLSLVLARDALLALPRAM